MVMYYRDINVVRMAKSKLMFKVVTPLNMFTAYYDPARPDHLLSITFDSRKELRKFHALLEAAITMGSADKSQGNK